MGLRKKILLVGVEQNQEWLFHPNDPIVSLRLSLFKTKEGCYLIQRKYFNPNDKRISKTRVMAKCESLDEVAGILLKYHLSEKVDDEIDLYFPYIEVGLLNEIENMNPHFNWRKSRPLSKIIKKIGLEEQLKLEEGLIA